MTIGKLRATASGKMLAFSSGKLMAECCCGRPLIGLTPDLEFYGVECDADTDTDEVTVFSNGEDGSVLTWGRSLSMDAGLVGFLSATPATGVLTAPDSEVITVSLDKSGVAAGTFEATLTVAEQLLSGVALAEIDIAVEIVTYASFPALMSLHGIAFPPAVFYNYNNVAKAQDATYCVRYAQVLWRKRADGDWIIDDSGTGQGPIEMWYNPDYAWESKYIYSFTLAGISRRVFLCESAVSPWTAPYPGTWNRGTEPETVAV